eukprot:GHVS01091425.1.p1 GENE.GHVS01091425.1~~GHVS01091425.1.p1  ORF type:complete len:151 (-),score=2.54 GHVS01091425.1:169-621(-)
MTGFWWNTWRIFTENEAIHITCARLCEDLQKTKSSDLTREQLDGVEKNTLCQRPTLLGMGAMWCCFVGLRKLNRQPFKRVVPQLLAASPVGLIVFSFTRHYIDFQFLAAFLGDPDSKLSAKLRNTYSSLAGPKSTTIKRLLDDERSKHEI